MKSRLLTFILLFGLLSQGMALSTDIIFNGRAGTALNGLTIYTDSTFTKPSFHSFSTGQLLEIIGETTLEHEDDAQNQTFKWYQVRASDGKTGWVFGDGLAVVLSTDEVQEAIKPYFKKKMKLGTGFEEAIIWMAAIRGHDNFHANTLLNPVYEENYIVVTNRRGKSIHIHYGGESTQGLSSIEQMQFQEVTGDRSPELILVRNNEFTGRVEKMKKLELYSFQAGTIKKVFEERLDIAEHSGTIFPSPYKFLEFDNKTIRVEYLEAKPCDQYTLAISGRGASDQCFEYITYTYHWDNRSRQYQMLYPESRSSPQAQVNNPGVNLQSAPNPGAARVCAIPPNVSFDLIRRQNNWTTERGRQTKEAYFYVKLKDGNYGYVPLQYVKFANTAQASQLDLYFRDPAKVDAATCFSIRNIHADSSAYNH